MNKHDRALEELVLHLRDFEENPLGIDWIMKDGIWMPEGSIAYNKLPDLIIRYYSYDWSLIELKSSPELRKKALEQLRSGARFVQSHFDFNSINKKIVYYLRGRFEYEVID